MNKAMQKKFDLIMAERTVVCEAIAASNDDSNPVLAKRGPSRSPTTAARAGHRPTEPRRSCQQGLPCQRHRYHRRSRPRGDCVGPGSNLHAPRTTGK